MSPATRQMSPSADQSVGPAILLAKLSCVSHGTLFLTREKGYVLTSNLEYKCPISLLSFIQIKRGLWYHLAVCVFPLTTFCMCIRCRGNVFTEPLPSKSRLIWFHYFSFQASCHIALKSCWARCFLCDPCRIKYLTCSERSVAHFSYQNLLVFLF
jgi:hypothetical protein